MQKSNGVLVSHKAYLLQIGFNGSQLDTRDDLNQQSLQNEMHRSRDVPVLRKKDTYRIPVARYSSKASFCMLIQDYLDSHGS
jgi:hypothetical protein